MQQSMLTSMGSIDSMNYHDETGQSVLQEDSETNLDLNSQHHIQLLQENSPSGGRG